LYQPTGTNHEEFFVDSLQLSPETVELPQLFLNIRSTQDGQALFEDPSLVTDVLRKVLDIRKRWNVHVLDKQPLEGKPSVSLCKLKIW
jgi:hypothetical protein